MRGSSILKKIVLTGGGTAGHVTPNLALVPALKEAGYEIAYIGSYTGIEKELVEKEGIEYHGISSGKLRRYFDVKNFSDPFKVLKGYGEAKKLLKEMNPDIVFSKGGYVSVPVVLAAHSLHIPAVIHESDMTPGLANKLAGRGATAFCCNFPETMQYLPADKAVLTGTPIRQQLFDGSRSRGLAFAGLTGEKPVLLIICGSLGSVSVNTMIREILPKLTEKFDIIHLTGKGNLDESLVGKYAGYKQFEYINEQLPDLFAAADVVISRAGANAICELLALAKPNVLVPLPASASRGDQLLNAASFEKQGFSLVIDQDEKTAEDLYNALTEVYDHRERYVKAMKDFGEGNGAIAKIVGILEKYRKK